MKRNVNVFLAVVLVAMLCGGIIWLRTAKDEKLGWNIHDTYGEAPAYSNNGAAYTNATFVGPSAGEGGVMPSSSSSAFRARTSYSHAGAYAISYGVSSAPLTSNLSPLTYDGAGGGQGLYTTSSKTFNSYGGGGNGGAAMSYSQSPIANRQSNSGSFNPSLQGGAGVGSISPIAYSTARRGEMVGGAGVNPAMMAAENPVMAMTNAASAGMDNGMYGGYTAMDYSGSANYGQYTGMFGGGSRMGVRGRQNAQGFDDLWWVWFDTWANSKGGAYKDENGDFYFDDGSLRNVYDAFIAGYWNSGMGEAPSFDDWKEWYLAAIASSGGGFYDYNGRHYYWGSLTPVGDILPLLLIALLYIVAMYLRSKSRTQVID